MQYMFYLASAFNQAVHFDLASVPNSGYMNNWMASTSALSVTFLSVISSVDVTE